MRLDISLKEPMIRYSERDGALKKKAFVALIVGISFG